MSRLIITNAKKTIAEARKTIAEARKKKKPSLLETDTREFLRLINPENHWSYDIQYYYGYRSRKGETEPFLTICLIKPPKGRIVRGIALCSPNDQPEKRIGRAHAYSRAISALQGNKRFIKYVPKWIDGALHSMNTSICDLDTFHEDLLLLHGQIFNKKQGILKINPRPQLTVSEKKLFEKKAETAEAEAVA